MWSINSDCTFAENKKTGATLRCDYGKDGLIRIKKNYKTIGTFTTLEDAKFFLADTVKKWNGDNYEQV